MRKVTFVYHRISRIMRRLAAFSILVGLLWTYSAILTSIQIAVILAASISGYVVFYLRNFIRIVILTVRRDAVALFRVTKLMYTVRRCLRNNITVPDLFAKLVKKHPNKVCFYYEDQQWTYKQIDEYSNRVANVFHKLGYKNGDVVALFMESRPEFVAIWLGISKLGMCTALINFNLRHQTLIHSIQAAQAKALIFGAELISAAKEVQTTINHEFKYYCCGPIESCSPAVSLDIMMGEVPPTPPPPVHIQSTSKCVYIYTSGTTGLPKPAVITHSRYEYMVIGFYSMAGFRPDDIIYTPLPLYHSAGGAIGVGQAIINGVSVVIRKKFSASKFWEDCIKYDCTIAQYIGETCRYLLSQPPKSDDTRHRVRLMYGNGLRPQIWNAFVQRFNIPNMCEFYGATEGNANIINFPSKVGAVGFISVICPWIYPVTLIRVDELTGEPIRDKNGLCIRCKPGESGEFVGKIIPNDPLRAFSGYVNKAASQKKVIRDVYKKGDSAFLSGDVLLMDEQGFFYFKDRTGDTFRWKGENVATAEVEAVISNVTNFRDCVVYGVEVPGSEGRAGMATIMDADGSLDIQNLTYGVTKALPVYARPLFIRITSAIEMTGTYKMKKVDLQMEGFNPTVHKDKIYFLSVSSCQYVPMTLDNYNNILTGTIRL